MISQRKWWRASTSEEDLSCLLGDSKNKIRQVAQSDLIWVAALYDVVYFHQVFLMATQMCGNDEY